MKNLLWRTSDPLQENLYVLNYANITYKCIKSVHVKSYKLSEVKWLNQEVVKRSCSEVEEETEVCLVCF